MYGCEAIADIKTDIEKTLERCIEIEPKMIRLGIFKQLLVAIARIFAPML